MAEPTDEKIDLPPASTGGAGANIMWVHVVKDKVVIRFPNEIAWAALDPQTAVSVGEAMARAAFKVRYGREPRANVDVLAEEIKKRTVDKVREMMIVRCTVILRQLLERGRKPEYIATEVIDRLLQEIT